MTCSPDDALEREIGSDGQVLPAPSDEAYLKALASVLDEWDTPEDAAAFDEL